MPQDETATEVRREGQVVVEDNSLGRLLTLSDGIFAIAMTLLALDLKVPDLGAHPSDASLRHALAVNSDSYLSFLLTFYVIASYWRRHRLLIRSVVAVDAILIRDTMLLLLLVAAMPFPASLLGRYGGEPISLALYGAVNALATVILILTSWDVRRRQLAGPEHAYRDDVTHSLSSWLNVIVFVLCIPAGYVLGHHGPLVLVLLLVPEWLSGIRKLAHRRPAAAAGTAIAHDPVSSARKSSRTDR